MKHTKESMGKAILSALSNHFENREDLPEIYEFGINPDTLDVIVIEEGDGIGGWWDLPDGFTYENLVDLEPETIEACVARIDEETGKKINVYVVPVDAALITDKRLFDRDPDGTYDSVTEATDDVEKNDLQPYWDRDIVKDCPYHIVPCTDDWYLLTFHVTKDAVVYEPLA